MPRTLAQNSLWAAAFEPSPPRGWSLRAGDASPIRVKYHRALGTPMHRRRGVRQAAGWAGVVVALLVLAIPSLTLTLPGEFRTDARTTSAAPVPPLLAAERSLGCSLRTTAEPVDCPTAPHPSDAAATTPASGINSSAWIPVPEVQAPSPRYGAAMVDDESDGYVLLFGGGTTPPGGGVVVLGDTWIFSNGVWTNITSLVGRSPPPRLDAGIAYDSSDGYVVMFGGTTGVGGGAVLNDTWTFHDQVWTQVARGLAPSQRTGVAMAGDSADGSVLLFGGCIAQNCSAGVFNDTWSFHAGNWTHLATPGAVPSARARASLAFDASDAQMVLFGGGTATARFNDTWSFRAGSWTELHPAVAPSSRSIAGMAYDPSVGSLVLFGGKYYGDFYADTWLFTAGNWTIVSSVFQNTPPPRGDPAMVYDPQMGSVLLMGGETFFPGTLNDTWVLTANYGNVTGTIVPRTATVAVDGTILPVVSGGFHEALLPGSHTLQALATGYAPQSDTFKVTEGGTTVITVSLSPSVPTSTNSTPSSSPVFSTTAWIVVAILAGSTGFLAGTTMIYRSRPPPPERFYSEDEPDE